MHSQGSDWPQYRENRKRKIRWIKTEWEKTQCCTCNAAYYCFSSRLENFNYNANYSFVSMGIWLKIWKQFLFYVSTFKRILYFRWFNEEENALKRLHKCSWCFLPKNDCLALIKHYKSKICEIWESYGPKSLSVPPNHMRMWAFVCSFVHKSINLCNNVIDCFYSGFVHFTHTEIQIRQELLLVGYDGIGWCVVGKSKLLTGLIRVNFNFKETCQFRWHASVLCVCASVWLQILRIPIHILLKSALSRSIDRTKNHTRMYQHYYLVFISKNKRENCANPDALDVVSTFFIS